jgi:hypothetical protein
MIHFSLQSDDDADFSKMMKIAFANIFAERETVKERKLNWDWDGTGIFPTFCPFFGSILLPENVNSLQTCRPKEGFNFFRVTVTHVLI